MSMLKFIFLVLLAVSAHFFFFRTRHVGYKGKWVLITGCDSGFGKALALQLLSLECSVFATCYTTEGAEELKRAASKHIDRLVVFVLDITDEEGIAKTANSVESILANQGDELWGLVNNAGFNDVNCPDDWLTLDHYKNIMNINCYGHIRMCKAFGRLIKKSQGRIVFNSSVRGRLTMPEAGPYTMSKYALEAYADTLRQEMYFFGVKVAIIEPGGFQTAMADYETVIARNIEKLWHGLDAELKRQWPYETLVSRMKSLQHDEIRSTDFSPVIDAMVDGLFADSPKTRYLAGSDAVFQHQPISFLPGGLQDVIMRMWMYSRWSPPIKPSNHAGSSSQ